MLKLGVSWNIIGNMLTEIIVLAIYDKLKSGYEVFHVAASA